MAIYSNARPNAYGNIRAGYWRKNPYQSDFNTYVYYGKSFSIVKSDYSVFFNLKDSNYYAVTSCCSYQPNKKWYIRQKHKDKIICSVDVRALKKDLAKILIDLEEGLLDA